MKRPGPVGITMVLAFAIVAAIEIRTLFGMFGIEMASQTYYGISAGLIVLVILALFALPEKESQGRAGV